VGEVVAGHFPPLTEGEVVRKSNRHAQRSVVDGFGCERLSMSFPVSDLDDSPETWPMRDVRMAGTADERWSRGRRFSAPDPVTGEADRVSMFVGVTEIAGQLWGKVEANPSRFADPSGYALLPLAQMEAAVKVMALTASLVVQPAIPVESWNVKRVDMARDFTGVGEPWFFVQGLLHVHRPHARKTYLYHDASKGNAQTLWAGSGAGGCRLYDQHEAYADKGAPEGSLRWEVEARGGRDSWLDKVGVTDVESLVERNSGLWALAERRWEWSGMGREIASVSAAIHAARTWVDPKSGKPLSNAKRRRLLGDMLEEALGVRTPSAKEAEAEYRRIKADLGYVMVPALEQLVDTDRGIRGRLDWESGTALVAA